MNKGFFRTFALLLTACFTAILLAGCVSAGPALTADQLVGLWRSTTTWTTPAIARSITSAEELYQELEFKSDGTMVATDRDVSNDQESGRIEFAYTLKGSRIDASSSTTILGSKITVNHKYKILSADRIQWISDDALIFEKVH